MGEFLMPTQDSVIPFAPASTPAHADQLDRAGQTVLQLLNKAAGVAEENSRHAIGLAQELSHKLRAAEGRIAELEGQAAAYQEQAERAPAPTCAHPPRGAPARRK
jgi:TolA-binding protein